MGGPIPAPEAAKYRDRLERHIGALCNPETPSYLIETEYHKVFEEACRFYERNFHPACFPTTNKKGREATSSFKQIVDLILFKKGFRENPITGQEHELCGSSEGDGFPEQHYVPLDLLKDKMTLAEAERARDLRLISWAFTFYYEKEQTPEIVQFPVLLERLDRSGSTRIDPRPLSNIELARGRIEILPFKKSEDFPFKRD